MSLPSPFARKVAICLGLFLALPAALFSQTNYYGTNGTEFAIATTSPTNGLLPGDQVMPDAALNSGGGFVVWQDNITDGSGWGISATRLDSTLSPSQIWSDVRVNATGTNDQENARVALLKNGGAVFVWQGGVEGFQHIYARFLSPTNTFLTTTDVVVSVPTKNFQINPAVAVLNNSNVVVVWGSFDEVNSNSMQDVYGQIFSQTGQKIGGEFLINQFTNYNQRTPAITALKNGGFIVAWISEQERIVGAPNVAELSPSQLVYPSVDVYARFYSSNGVAAGNEFLVNTDANPCANPGMAAGSDGGFILIWSAHDSVNLQNGWDIYARPFSSAGLGGMVQQVNAYTYGDQYMPRISVIGTGYFVLWTSLGQDGSREGVFGQFLNSNASPVNGEFLINSTTAGQQMQPVVASDGVSQFFAAWTGYSIASSTFDLFAQRYVNIADVLLPMSAPFVLSPFVVVSNHYQPQLMISWTPLQGISVSNYQVFVDGAATPMGIVSSANNSWTMMAANGLTTSSTHSFAINYVTTAGGSAPLSPPASGTTWSGLNYYGIPFEWMEQYYNDNFSDWPGNVNAPLVPGGPTLLQIFQSGGNPNDPTTWLQQKLVQTQQGIFLTWNTQPGFTYQVQFTTNVFRPPTNNFGSARFAAGTSDSIYLGMTNAGHYFRIQKVSP